MIELSLIVASYLLGSIPFGLIFSKIFGLGNIRDQGSGNIGATNVMRVGGKLPGILTFIFDALKGYIAVFLAMHYLPGSMSLHCLYALLAVLGHMFPVWLRFQGGKGVATTFSVTLALSTFLGVIMFITWVSSYFITKTSSISSLFSTLVTTLIALICMSGSKLWISATLLALTSLVFYKHIENIKRLIRGTELKV
ncbi:MAG: glycerol-3-phosphate 1-O-acyltransferase PlsY [Alphaproteobacteria bacterium]|jgi:glycerol-3-phosphate acyltransferase PlsY|nr:glycerol-3-phosphate 1-O-acyltransferase PlsY [Candidatus Jidaibacter sp.]